MWQVRDTHTYHFWLLVHFVGLHSHYSIPGTQEQHTWFWVQQEGAEVGHAPEFIWTKNGVCGAKGKEKGSDFKIHFFTLVLLSVIQLRS